jgi:hypothetical protein
MARRPGGETFETFVEKQIREAEERGELRGLEGEGKPIEDLDAPPDELWWVKKKLRREGLSYTPPELEQRRAIDLFYEELASLSGEAEVRARAAALNDQIGRANARVLAGPMTCVAGVDVERAVLRWREVTSRSGKA